MNSDKIIHFYKTFIIAMIGGVSTRIVSCSIDHNKEAYSECYLSSAVDKQLDSSATNDSPSSNNNRVNKRSYS